jgi:hypothetical protein
MEYDPTDLSLLKEKLRLELAEIKAQEEASRQRMRPQTMAEVDEVESLLKTALDEVRHIRSEMERKKP